MSVGKQAKFLSVALEQSCVQHVPTPDAILQLCGRLAVYLELDQFPVVDIGLLASRYITELNLPCMYLILMCSLLTVTVTSAKC